MRQRLDLGGRWRTLRKRSARRRGRGRPAIPGALRRANPLGPELLLRWYLAILALLPLLPCGCGERRPPGYDRARSMEIREYFRAVQTGDQALARRKLTRLEDWLPGTSYLETLQAQARRQDTLGAANAKLARLDLAGAARAIEDAQEAGLDPVLGAARNQVQALQKVQDYCARTPYPDAAADLQALAQLPPPADLGTAAPAYSAWLARQQTAARQRQARERQQWHEEMYAEIDLAAARGEPLLPLLLARLGAADPADPVHAAWLRLQQPRVNRLASLELPPGPSLACDLTLHLILSTGTRQEQLLAAKLRRERPPASVVGELSAAEALLLEGRPSAGLAAFRDLAARIPAIDGTALAQLLRRGDASLPRPTPAAAALLANLYQLP